LLSFVLSILTKRQAIFKVGGYPTELMTSDLGPRVDELSTIKIKSDWRNGYMDVLKTWIVDQFTLKIKKTRKISF